MPDTILLSLLVVVFFMMVMGAVLAYFGVLGRRWRVHSHFRSDIDWEDRGPTPEGENRYTPQGLTFADGRLIFANSWRNTRSRVYELDPATMQYLRHFDMPPGAVHTSGLAWDGWRLWAVDYITNCGYCIDLQASLAQGQVKLLGQFETTLRGTSACCFVLWEEQQLLAISDFMNTQRTIFIRHEDALAAGTARGAIEFSYRNGGFSQGLEFIDGFLFEAENRRGLDVIHQLDLQRLRESGEAAAATVWRYDAPNGGVEDLAWDGESLWTSDEVQFRFYCGKLLVSDTAPERLPDAQGNSASPA